MEALWQKQRQNQKPTTAIIALWLARAAKNGINTRYHRIAHGISRLANRYGVTSEMPASARFNQADQQIQDTLQTDEEWETYHNVTQ